MYLLIQRERIVELFLHRNLHYEQLGTTCGYAMIILLLDRYCLGRTQDRPQTDGDCGKYMIHFHL